MTKDNETKTTLYYGNKRHTINSALVRKKIAPAKVPDYRDNEAEHTQSYSSPNKY